MRNLGLRILINAAALIVTSLIIPGSTCPRRRGGDWVALIVIALIFALINSSEADREAGVTARDAGHPRPLRAGHQRRLLLLLAWICGLVGLLLDLRVPPDFSLNAI
jgi:hypothetical protein